MRQLFINDIFWTFQGEGLYSGRRSLFVRMPKCNLDCSWCDTDFSTYKKMSFDDFISFANQESSRFAVITGGEPLMHRHTPIVVDILKGLGFYIAVETNGTFPSINGIDFVTCSPKKDANYKIDENLYFVVSEFKYVVDNDFDFSILNRHIEDKTHSARLSLSPEFGNMQQNINKITAFIQKYPQWRLNLQTHKWIGIA